MPLTLLSELSTLLFAGWMLVGAEGPVVHPPAPVPPAAATPAPDPPLTPVALRCEVPLRWRLAEVDPRFGLEVDEAEWLIREAGMLWEEGRDRLLFIHDPSNGLPIRFVWDGREETARERRVARLQLAGEEARIRELQAELESLREHLPPAQEAYRERLSRYDEELRRHTAEVADWNTRGGAPQRERIRLQAEREALDRAKSALDAEAEELNRLSERISQETASLNQDVRGFNELSTHFSERFAAVDSETGSYLESVGRFGRRAPLAEREIRISQFESREHLVLVLARQLGRALTLPLSGEPGTVMGAGAVPIPGPEGPRLSPADLALLVEICRFPPITSLHHGAASRETAGTAEPR